MRNKDLLRKKIYRQGKEQIEPTLKATTEYKYQG